MIVEENPKARIWKERTIIASEGPAELRIDRCFNHIPLWTAVAACLFASAAAPAEITLHCVGRYTDGKGPVTRDEISVIIDPELKKVIDLGNGTSGPHTSPIDTFTFTELSINAKQLQSNPDDPEDEIITTLLSLDRTTGEFDYDWIWKHPVAGKEVTDYRDLKGVCERVERKF